MAEVTQEATVGDNAYHQVRLEDAIKAVLEARRVMRNAGVSLFSSEFANASDYLHQQLRVLDEADDVSAKGVEPPAITPSSATA